MTETITPVASKDAKFPTSHQAPDSDVFELPKPLQPPTTSGRRRTAAEESRAIVAQRTVATLATLSDDGTPWASMVVYGSLPDGSPVISVSTLSEHGRNLHSDYRASLSIIADEGPAGDPLDRGRLTLAGTFIEPTDKQLLKVAEQAYIEKVPAGRIFTGFDDFTTYLLKIDRIRWVGGYGRMETVALADFQAAEVDPVVHNAPGAVRHLNEDHSDALLLMAQNLAGYTDATAAKCQRIDRYGLDMQINTPRGIGYSRVAFPHPAKHSGDLRSASVELVGLARES